MLMLLTLIKIFICEIQGWMYGGDKTKYRCDIFPPAISVALSLVTNIPINHCKLYEYTSVSTQIIMCVYFCLLR